MAGAGGEIVVAPGASVFEDRKAAFASKWSAFKRRTSLEGKSLADEFEPIYSAIPHGGKRAWLDEIGMGPDMAERLVRIAREIQIPLIAEFESWSAMVRSLPTKKAALQPPPPVAQDSDHAAPAVEIPEEANESYGAGAVRRAKKRQIVVPAPVRVPNRLPPVTEVPAPRYVGKFQGHIFQPASEADEAAYAEEAQKDAFADEVFAAAVLADTQPNDAPEDAAPAVVPAPPVDGDLDTFAAEEIADAAAEAKDARDEMLAMRLEGSDLEAVEALGAGMDRLEKQLADARAQMVKANKKSRARRRSSKRS